MNIPFAQLPDHARLWIYQAAAPFSPETEQRILLQLQAFLTDWAAHGNGLTAGAEIRHNRFVLIGVDETQAPPTGCSIDKSVALLKALEQQEAISLFDRTVIAFMQEEHLSTARLSELKALVAEGKLKAGTLVFNNTIERKGQLNSEWLQPAGLTWLKKYFTSVSV